MNMSDCSVPTYTGGLVCVSLSLSFYLSPLISLFPLSLSFSLSLCHRKGGEEFREGARGERRVPSAFDPIVSSSSSAAAATATTTTEARYREHANARAESERANTSACVRTADGVSSFAPPFLHAGRAIRSERTALTRTHVLAAAFTRPLPHIGQTHP